MDARTVEITIKVYLKEMRERPERAASIADAAEACADAGTPRQRRSASAGLRW